MPGDLMLHLEELRNRGGRRLTGVETIRAARALQLDLELLTGPCSSEGTSQRSMASHTPGGVWTAVFDGRRVNLCPGCARRFLHGRAAWMRTA